MSKSQEPGFPEANLPPGDARARPADPTPAASGQKQAAPVIRIDGKKIACTGQYASILECLEAADVEVHYHCRDGFCGACRVSLCQGQVTYPQGEPLAFVGEGEILACCSLPVTDITLELD